MRKITLVWLLAIFIFAYILRVAYLPQNALTFGYDQARDAIQAQNIIAGDIKIQGPPASTPGMHHGVFWFYYLVPPNLLSGGNPIVSAYWNALFNAAVVFIVFALTYLLVKRVRAALLAAFLFAISFEATQYATWLSNPTIGVWTVPLMYLGLWIWITAKNDKTNKNLGVRTYLTSGVAGPLLTGLGLGLSMQANVFLMYHAVPVLIWLVVARISITKKSIFVFLTAGFAAVFTMLLTEAKFGFKSFAGALSLLSAQDSIVASKKLGDFIILFANQLGDVYARNSYPGNVGYGAVFVLALIFISLYQWGKTSFKKNNKWISWQPFLAVWLFAHTTVVSVGGTATPFLLVGIGPAVAILIGIFLDKWWSEGKGLLTAIVLAILVFGNLNMITKENPKGQTIFAIQKDMLLSKQLKAVDYMYDQASGEKFSVNSLTSPLWINIVWSYLFDWYGEDHYGYVPEWHGKGQEGQLKSLSLVQDNTTNYFLILEPMGGIPMRYLGETLAEENSKSTLLDEANWGELRVQKRVKMSNDVFDED